MRGDHLIIDIPPSWQQALDSFSSDPGTIMILGAMDAGKSTLTRVVLRALQQRAKLLAWVDCDVGQSDLGPPTTICLKFLDSSTTLDQELQPDAMRFVGSTSPSGHLLPMVVGTQRLVHHARGRGAEAIVVNTTGMVFGGPARALNTYLIDAVQPDHILALQRQSEIEHLLRPVGQQRPCQIHRLPVSEKARLWSREARREIRQARFQSYFQPGQTHIFKFSQLSLQNTFLRSGLRLSDQQLADASMTLDTRIEYGEQCGDGVFLVAQGRFRGYNIPLLQEIYGVEQVAVIPSSDFENRLVGLCDAANDLLALGLLQHVDWTDETLLILTPLVEPELHKARAVQFGSLKVDRTGVELSGSI